MPEINIRNYQPGDEPAISTIVYRTGFNGEDLTGRNFIDDQRLFFLMFAAYYIWYEPQNCFVAVDNVQEKVVGYILGTPNTQRQEKRFLWTMIGRIVGRLLFVTSWRYPQSFRTLLRMSRMGTEMGKIERAPKLTDDYPAHLHIDLLPEYQSMGIGSRLIRCFEEHITSLGIRGIHLRTSNHNYKAIPFYRKLGYALLSEVSLTTHPAAPDYAILTFAKKLA